MMIVVVVLTMVELLMVLIGRHGFATAVVAILSVLLT
jgi:hypothetical protein